MNHLYFGDNLEVLKRQRWEEDIDLIYLDPPFNSHATYNVLFGERGTLSEAQAEAFRDTWQWGESAAIAFDEAVKCNDNLALLMRSFRTWMGDSSMMAYLAMMAARLIYLHRALKPKGTLYLHCDPTASHYLKLTLDSIFGHRFFGNELIWQRTTPKGHAFTRFARSHDVILRYTKGEEWTWNPIYLEHDPDYVEKFYRHVEPGTNRRYQLDNLINPNKNRPNLTYEFLGVKRVWRWTRDRMEDAYANGIVVQTKPGTVPRLKRYLDEQEGVPATDVWTDIRPVQSQSQERLEYPTQKPLALLERIINASSNEGDLVLDPFCGCGTTIEAAQKTKRQWVGIDVTHYAVTLIEKRLARYNQKIFDVHGRPTDMAGAVDLARRDKYQFQWWAAWLLGATTYETKKGADRGIDANIYFPNGRTVGRIIVSVKGGDNPSPVWVRELAGVVDREKADMGILITLSEPTRAMLSDAARGPAERIRFGKYPLIQIATVADMLDQHWPTMPPIPKPLDETPRTHAAEGRDQLELMLPFKRGSIVTETGEFVDPRWIQSA
ncbi:MAG TPA: DNA methyltransferase [Rhizomicrobium sp.]|jgi:site-specific DNA-methyltransferase (adenine-specific)|nr:DNA methyltransferase [Rhizomicrobium sp.]